MKINNPASWGIVLALLSTASASMLAPGDSCNTHADCTVGADGLGQFCASDGFCTPVGGCATLEDCNLGFNSGFAMITCIGTKVCENRMCGMRCDGTPIEEPPSAACTTHTDCPSTEYCASDGVCERMGGCATVDDCKLAENSGYPIATCFGSLGCMERTCQMQCTGSDALFRCETSDDCTRVGMYCGGYGHCEDHGHCSKDEDCDNESNIFMEIECVGTRFCGDNGMCGKKCDGGEPIDAGEPLPDLCVTNDECPQDGAYCAGNGICTKSGYCDRPADCTAPGNDIMLPACVGTVTCDAGQCGKICDGAAIDTPVSGEKETEDNGAPVDVNLVTCFTDDDCNDPTAATARSAVGQMFCAQGACVQQGNCLSDTDCVNPANFIWNDKRCMGYLHCTSEGVCDRECGVMCKDGSKSATCFEDECAKINWTECVGAAGCVLDTCDNTCSALLFDAAGNVMDTCVIPDPSDTSDLNKAMPETTTKPDLSSPDGSTSEVMKFGSSAARATSVVAIVLALSATIIV